MKLLIVIFSLLCITSFTLALFYRKQQFAGKDEALMKYKKRNMFIIALISLLTVLMILIAPVLDVAITEYISSVKS